MIKVKSNLKTVGYIHPVRELLTKSNYEIIDKIAKYAAPPYILIMLHNAMELMLRDFFTIQKAMDCENWTANNFIQEAEKKIKFVKKNIIRFKDFNRRRNQIYHKSPFTIRIENLIDDYRLITRLYEEIYKRRFISPMPSKIEASLFLCFYSLFISYILYLARAINNLNYIIVLVTFIIGLGASIYSLRYFLRQRELCGYFPIKYFSR